MKHGFALLLIATTAAADPTANAEAEALFREGRDLLAAGDTARACDAFERSQRIDPTIGTLLNVGDCREKNGQLATAWAVFLDAERQTRNATDDDTRHLHDIAVAHAASLEPRVPKLAINVTRPVPGLAIRRGDAPVDPNTWNHPGPIDGGTYTIVASAPGYVEWSSSVTVHPDGDTQQVDVPALSPIPVVVPPPPPPPSRLPYYVGGASLAVLGVALAFDLAGNSTYDASKVEVDDAKQRQLLDTANHERYAAEAFAIAGLAAAGVAVYLYLRPSSHVAATSHGVAWRF